jgi:hypothetical protein
LNQGGKLGSKRKVFEQIECQGAGAVRRENGDTLSSIILKNYGLRGWKHKRAGDRYSGERNGLDDECVGGNKGPIAKAKI